MMTKAAAPALHSAAFTLAEILFAMAILAFTLLSIIGLMPATLSELNNAEARLAEARILHTLNAEYQTKNWTAIIGSQLQTVYYFDKGGNMIGPPNRSGDPEDYPSFAAAVYIKDAPSQPGDGDDAMTAHRYLRTLRVVITRQIESQQAMQDRYIAGTNRIYAIIVASQDSDRSMPLQ
jgi:uncharacterized protein (TIGR02598 family)